VKADIRHATAEDLDAITRIYNHYIRETVVTFDLEPISTVDRRPWFDAFACGGAYQILVMRREAQLLGYASSQRFRAKAAYDTTVETSVYLDPNHTGQGHGTRLYEALFEALRGAGLHRAIAAITLPNEHSVALHGKFGFEPAGVLREVGHKHGKYWDVQWLQKDLAL
jgi:phosphinothricin acetyltransferase